MKNTRIKALATTAVCTLALTGTLAGPSGTASAAVAAKENVPSNVTNFGMTALTFGTKVAVGGIDVRTLKDANTIQACTRTVGLDRVAPSVLSTEQITALLGDSLPVDVASLIRLSPSTSTTSTYQEGAITGVRATNTIADIQLGGELVDNVALPTVKIEGLTAVADSFYDPADTDGDGRKYGTNESFNFTKLSLQLPQDGVVTETLDMLLQNLGYSTEEINAGITETISVPVDTLTDTLEQITETAGLGDVIELPGLGTIGLGSSFRKIGTGGASSGANALQISVKPEGLGEAETALLKLGYAQSRISAPARNGVFRSTFNALNFRAVPLAEGVEALHLAGINTQAIPCEGTYGKKVVHEVAGSRSIPLNIPGVGGLATLNGIKYTYLADQLDKGQAKSFSRSEVGSLDIPALGLRLEGMASELKLRSYPGERVRGSEKPQFTVSKILLNGKSIKPLDLKVGQVIEFPIEGTDQTGFITFGDVHSRNWYGTKMSAINITVPNAFSMDLGWLESQIYPR